MDREKVIKGLEILINGCGYIDCDDCCFYISTKPTRCGLREEQIQEDALALLKEQEAVKPKSKSRHGSTTMYQHFCGNCMAMLHGKPKYCPNCGRSVKWE